ncbi:tetratricopeptide repeat protein [uncultured Kriegella sp.]|uniref:tetratricopeptide repeat-containing sensor histidine kinase n=1 Tax=uncultured Kriegella sp. TaxID=1798910 RepID=UPI0030D94B26|tara:strand:+ start:46395 stop:48398 length:2004 start_codon:yes stop_codon:yes gene_type:complete
MRKLEILVFLVFSFFNLIVYAQKNDGRTEIDMLIGRGDSLLRANHKEQAFDNYQEALTLARAENSISALAALYKKIGVYHYLKKEFERAEENYMKSLQLDSTTKTAADTYYNHYLLKRKLPKQGSILPYLEKSIALYKVLEYDASTYNAYLSAGTVYKNNQLYDKALELLLLAHTGFSELNDTRQLAKVCSVIGNIHNHLKNYDQALGFHKQALELGKLNDVKNENSNHYNNLAIVYKNLGQQDSAIVYYNQALKLLESDDVNYGKILYNLANLYKAKKQGDLAKEYFEASIFYKKKKKDTAAVMYSYNGMADLMLLKGDLKATKIYLDSVASFFPHISDQLVLLDYYKNQVAYQREVGAYKSASDYQKRYSELFEKVYDLERTEIIQTMQSRFAYEKKVNENLQLSLANQNNLLLLEQQRGNLLNKNWMLALLGLVVLLLAISYYVYAQKQKTKEQALKIEKLEAIYQGQETIKKRIARDLHDIVAANFNGLRLKVLAMPRASNQAELAENIASDIEVVNDQVRKVSHRLFPLEMMAKGRPFTAIMKSQLAEFQLYRKIEVQLEQELPPVLNDLDFEVQNHIYSILLEVLHNVAKHAQATQLEIDCELTDEKILQFKIKDNGMGLNNSAKSGIGLLNIKQRAELLGGCSSIQKVSGGTEVKFSFPI